MDTTNNIAKPTHVISLATSGILVHVEIKNWNATVTDTEVTNEITDAKGADRDAGKFVKELLSGVPEFKALTANRSAVYNWVKAETYPWAGAWRYLPNNRIPKFMEEYKTRYAVTRQLAEALITALPGVIADLAWRSTNQMGKQGAMFRREDYPANDEIPQYVRSKVGITLHTSDVPMGDFRNKISQDLADDLHNHYVQQAEGFKNAIIGAQRDQLVDVLTSISKACDPRVVTKEDGTTKVHKGKLFESTLEKAIKYCDTIKDLNLDDDPKLEEARLKLENVLSGVTVETFRKSDTQRAVVKDGIESILSKFGM